MADDAQFADLSRKIVTLRELELRFGKRVDRSKSLVQCHGVFDLLHIGHIRHLQEARSLGDYLVVTITPDRFVNKGPHRPAFGERLRAESLAALACVDFVCINEWRTAVESIRVLAPDVFSKGRVAAAGPRDRNNAIDLEREAVEAGGGRVVMTDTELHSASALLNRCTNLLPPKLQAYLEMFREDPSSRGLVSSVAQFGDLRVLVVGESCVNIGGRSGDDRHSERYVGGALAVANVLSSFCDQVSVLTVGVGSDAANGFLQKNAAEGVDLVIPTQSEQPDGGIEAPLDRLLDRCEIVLWWDAGSDLCTPRAQAMMSGRASFFAVNIRNRAPSSRSARYPLAPDLIVQAESGSGATRSDDASELSQSFQAVVCAEKTARESGCKRVLIVCRNAGVIVFDRSESVWAEVPALPVNEVNYVDLQGTGEARFALAALSSARGLSPDAAGFVANVASATASTLSGSGHRLDPTAVFRHIDSLLK